MFLAITNPDKYRLINLLASQGIREPLLTAFDEVPREVFCEKTQIDSAYEDRRFLIKFGHLINQPSLVALCISALNIIKTDIVLEIGTGSGYQTALLAKSSKQVYSVESELTLYKQALSKLKKLNITNVESTCCDEEMGWGKNASYDKIIVWSPYKDVPRSFITQLKNGGKLLIPIINNDMQDLTLFSKNDNELVLLRKIMKVKL